MQGDVSRLHARIEQAVNQGSEQTMESEAQTRRKRIDVCLRQAGWEITRWSSGLDKQAHTHVDRLTQSLLAKAFRGEFVPTEHALATAAIREYETAPALLARIRLNHDDQQKIVRTPDKKPAPATNKQPRKQKVTRQ